MITKIVSAAALTLALSASLASAQEKTQAGAGLFDQGGVFYNQQLDTRHGSGQTSYGSAGVDRGTTASIGNTGAARTNLDRPAVAPSGIPSDTRNERGLGMFDVSN